MSDEWLSNCNSLISIIFNLFFTTGAARETEVKMAARRATSSNGSNLELRCAVSSVLCSRLKQTKVELFTLAPTIFEKQSLTSHANSRQHLVCVTAKWLVDNPSSGPLTMLVRNLNADAHRVIARLITTAYHVIKTRQPSASFPRAIELQQKNGVDLGTQYRTDEMLWKLLYISIEEPEVSQFQPDRVVQRWLPVGERARHV